MASGTLISRILGVVRVALLAFILGTATRQADIYGLADMVPNSLYILFAGGALNTVLVPQIVRAIRQDDDGGEAYTNRIMTAFMLIITGVAVVVTIGAPVVARIYTSEAWRDPGLTTQYASLVALMFLTLPQIFFYGAFFLIGQILNARDKFGPMMWAPIANNVVAIAVLSTYLVIWGNQEDHSQAFTGPQILLLGLGSTAGIAVQTLVLLPFVKKVGFKLRPRFDLKGTGLGKTFSLTKWTIGFVAVNQLALVIVQRLATSATATGEGAGVVAYSNAHLLWILPHSLITVSLATAMLPSASRLAASGDTGGVAQEFMKTVRLALIVIVPATVVFLALARPTTGILFGQGAGRASSELIAWALMAFALGLIPFTVQFVTLRTFYALEDTRTPFFIQVLIAGLNMGLAIGLVAAVQAWMTDPASWIATALALAYSLAYAVGVLASWKLLKRRVPGIDGGAIALHIVRLLLASAVGGVAAYFAAEWLRGLIGSQLMGNIVALAVGGLLVLASYILIGKALKVRELTSLSTLVRTRFGRRSGEGATDASPISRSFDDFDSGPPTIIRNRPPVVERTFDELIQRPRPARAEEDAMDHQPSPDPYDDQYEETPVRRRDEPTFDDGATIDDEPSFDAGLGFDEDLTIPPGSDFERTTDVDEDSIYDDDGGPPTAPLDMAGLFRDEPAGQIASIGTLLHTRYELVEKLAARHGAETWRAHDQVLSRDVVVHVLAPGDHRIPELMTSARKGAVATDSRFLRVLDADEVADPEQGIGAYVVAEYAYGRSLKNLLTKGPLSAIESAHITRELADALVGMHGQGLFHEQINPDNVIITTSGAVRLVGFGIESTLAGRDPEDDGWASREHADVVGLGQILYASLVRHWPGGDKWGMPAAPIIAGETAAPHTVQMGISPALDRICVTTLTERGELSAPRIVSAAQMVNALTEVLGTADASLDLEQRVRSWHGTDDIPVRPVPFQEAPWTPVRPDEDSGGGLHSSYFRDNDFNDADSSAAATRVNPVVTPGTAGSPQHFDDDDYAVEERRDGGNRKWWLLLILLLAAVAVALALAFLGGDDTDTAEPGTDQTTSVGDAPTESPTGEETTGEAEEGSPDPAAPIEIVEVTDFDPETDGGNNEEVPERVGNVTDGDPSTTWVTMRYLNHPTLGNLKPGVGLVLDLGEARAVSSVDLTMVGGDTSIEVRVPNGDTASMRTEADWEVVASDDAAPDGEVTITLDEPVETQWVLVYFTELPPVEGGFRAEVAEVAVR